MTACSMDELDPNKVYPKDGNAIVNLEFTVANPSIVETKAAQSTYYEYLVQNIYVFMFLDGQRVKTSQSFFEPNGGGIENYKHKEADGEESGTLTFETATGSNMILCAIANIGTSNSVLDTKASVTEDGGHEVTDTDIARMDAIQTYDELKNLSVALDAHTVFRGASFLMTGEVPINLGTGQSLNVEIPLKRADSKITFNVNAASTSSDITELKFIPGKWRVVNAPARTWVLPPTVTAGATLTEDLDAAQDAEDFFTITDINAPQFEGAVNGQENSGTFTFYMYENLKAPKQEITNGSYALRELQTKNGMTEEELPGQIYQNGEYVYAPEKGTYVIFTGELSYSTKDNNDNDSYVIADVEYCVHLGYDNVANNVNDYSTIRNSHYTYNVTITGINSLIVEVENDNEDRPGAEGDVVASAAEIINVDGHYDRALITLTAEEASKIFFSVSTPFERGLDDNDLGDNQTTKTLKDYKWVKFLINSEVGVDNTTYAAFPGEACYDGGKTATGTTVRSEVYNRNVTLRDIRQLSTYLNANRPTGNTTITVFIDEYLYFYNPLNDPLGAETTYKSAYTATAAEDLIMWKKSVNQNDRMLHIVKAGDMKYSEDGETSLSKSVVTIKQRPVLTFYNVNAGDDLVTAWGTETINETPRLPITRSSFPTRANTDNDYTYAQKIASHRNNSDANSNWVDVISATNQYGLGTNYNDVSYACAMRNRDMDGDGVIDNSEMLWYQTSLNQLTDLWIGEPCMPSYAQLFNPSDVDGTYQVEVQTGETWWGRPIYTYYNIAATHYASSTISGGSPYVYWAEEYGATSTQAKAVEWGKAPSLNNTRIASVRCVRNFGMTYGSTETPQDYVILEGTQSTITPGNTNDIDSEYILNLNFMNPVALRSTPDNGNPIAYSEVDEIGENNRPYYGFYILPDYYGNGGLNSTTNWQTAYNVSLGINTTTTLCPEGYRVPNQREMIIMTSHIDGWNSDDPYIFYNRQQVVYTDGTTGQYGAFHFYPDDGRISRTLENDDWAQGMTMTSVVRCVKDNPDAQPSAASSYDNQGSLF